MTIARSRWLSVAASLGLPALWLTAGSAAARADLIELRGGGQIRGKLVPDPSKADRVLVIAERGKAPLGFDKARVVRVVPEASPLDDYVVKRQATPTGDADARLELGLWCEGNKLPDLARLHYEEAAEAGSAQAHEKLGHVLRGDRWLGGDDLREAQGMVRDKGRWVTVGQKEQLDRGRAGAAEQSVLVRRVRALREAIVYGAEDRRREAESQLLDLRDPAAVAPLVRVLGQDNGPLRILMAKALGTIPGPEAASALVARLLGEIDPGPRSALMDELERRDEDRLAVVKQLTRAVGSDRPEVVNRAAWALGNLRAVAAVPTLVGGLVRSKSEFVLEPMGGEPVPATGGYGYPRVAGAPIAYNGSSVGYLTPPAVAPGAVAFGAYSGPAYGIGLGGLGLSDYGGAGLSVGGGTAGASRVPPMRYVTTTVQNVEVLAALDKLTGQNFGYDIDAWRRWVRTSFQPDPVPARQVPQP